jgi:hypothetical protein
MLFAGPEACTLLHEGEVCLPGHGASTTGAEMQSTKSSSSRNKELGEDVGKSACPHSIVKQPQKPNMNKAAGYFAKQA